MSGRIAHDFNNTLTVILGYSDSLLHRLSPEDPIRREVREIFEAGERAAALLRRLITAAGRQPASPRPLDLNTVVAGLQPVLAGLLGADIELATVLDPALACVMADPAQIRRILANLALNARDAMPARGKLTIETANAPPDVILTVSDTGLGIPEEIADRLFEPFVSSKPPTGSVGLGLAEVYGIVTQIGARISVSSVPGHGAAFEISFPRLDGTPSLPRPCAVEAAPPAEAEPDISAQTVLIVDDEASVRGLIRQALAPYACTVLEAASGVEALAAAAVYEGKINIAIVDFVMPGLNGFDLALQIERSFPTLKTLYISSAVDSIGMSSLLRHAPDRVLIKPFTAAQLVERILALARGLP